MKNYALHQCKDVKNLRELISHVKQKWGAKDLFRWLSPDGSIISASFEQFAFDIESLGTFLCAKGLNGKNIAIMGENSYSWAASYFAATNSGGCAVPIDPELADSNVCDIITKTKTEVLFYASSCDEKIDAVHKGCPSIKYTFCLDKPVGDKSGGVKSIFDLFAEGRELVCGGDKSFSLIEIDNSATCAIIYTSGTTGTQKGVMLTHANIAANITAAVKAVHFGPEDVFLSLLPYHHTYECSCGLMVVMLWGSCICFNDSIRNIAKNLKVFSPTAMLLVPLYIETFYNKIMESVRQNKAEKKFKFALKLSSALLKFGIDKRQKFFSKILEFFGGRLKTVVCGGAYLRPYYVKTFYRFGIQVLQGYGITECSPLVAVNRNKYWKYDSVGLPIPCCEVKIDGDAENGEILIKGTNVMAGYYDNPALTAASFSDGWYKSGDIGYKDKNNFIYITGRKANMIVLKNGKNVSPEEIELELAGNDVIKEIVVVGRKDKDGVSDLFAYIKCRDEIDDNASPILYDKVGRLIKDFNARQPMHRQIRDFALVKKDFPKTTSKKIIRYRVGDDSDV